MARKQRQHLRRKKRKRSHYKTGTHTSSKAGECRYRSGWELRYMERLDADASVLKYSYEPVAIDYLSNKRTGKMRKYYPDFIVEYADGHRCLVEVKPKRRLKNAIVRKKLAAARVWCSENGFELVIASDDEFV